MTIIIAHQMESLRRPLFEMSNFIGLLDSAICRNIITRNLSLGEKRKHLENPVAINGRYSSMKCNICSWIQGYYR